MAKILSLHAESEVLNLLQIILRRAGYEYLSTTNSRIALSILREGNINLLIQNLMRPDVNGCEFYNIMRNDRLFRHIPVLIISTVNPLTYPEICSNVIQDLYPDHYLLMPFSPQELLSSVSRILCKSTTPPAT